MARIVRWAAIGLGVAAGLWLVWFAVVWVFLENLDI